MSSTIEKDIRDAAINLSDWDMLLDGPLAEQPNALLDKVASFLVDFPGFAIAFGTRDVLARHAVDIRVHQYKAYDLLESVFRGAMARVEFGRFAVIDRPMTLARMDVDGFNLNADFSHDGKI